MALTHAASAMPPDEVIANGKQRVDSLVERLGGVQSCGLRADVEVEFHTAPPVGEVAVGETITGSFEFSANGPMWLKRSDMDTALYPGMNTEIAYDGEVYQYHVVGEQIISVSFSGDHRVPGMTLPNPLIALGGFLVPASDGAPDVTLAHLQTLCTPDALDGAQWKVIETDNGPAAAATLPGGTYLGSEMVNRVIVPASDEAPLVMERATIAGQVVLRSTFSDWRGVVVGDGGSQLWPWRARFEGIDPATGEIGAEMTMTLTELTINTDPADPSHFLLDWEGAERVWLDEAETFIR